MTALCQGCLVVEAVDAGEEAGCIEQELADVNLEPCDHVPDDILFDGRQRVGRDAVHVVPESLAGQSGGGNSEQSGQDGIVVPVCEQLFRAGCEAAVESGNEDAGADGDAVAAAFWNVPVDPIPDIELCREVEQGGAGAEFVDGGLSGHGHLVPGGDEVFGGAEVLLPDDFRFAVDAL